MLRGQAGITPAEMPTPALPDQKATAPRIVGFDAKIDRYWEKYPSGNPRVDKVGNPIFQAGADVAQAKHLWDEQIQPRLAAGKKVAILYAANDDQAKKIMAGYEDGKIDGKMIQGGGQAKPFAKLADKIAAKEMQSRVHIVPVGTSKSGGLNEDGNQVDLAMMHRYLENIATHLGAGWEVVGMEHAGRFAIGGGASQYWNEVSPTWIEIDAHGYVTQKMADNISDAPTGPSDGPPRILSQGQYMQEQLDMLAKSPIKDWPDALQQAYQDGQEEAKKEVANPPPPRIPKDVDDITTINRYPRSRKKIREEWNTCQLFLEQQIAKSPWHAMAAKEVMAGGSLKAIAKKYGIDDEKDVRDLAELQTRWFRLNNGIEKKKERQEKKEGVHDADPKKWARYKMDKLAPVILPVNILRSCAADTGVYVQGFAGVVKNLRAEITKDDKRKSIKYSDKKAADAARAALIKKIEPGNQQALADEQKRLEQIQGIKNKAVREKVAPVIVEIGGVDVAKKVNDLLNPSGNLGVRHPTRDDRSAALGAMQRDFKEAFKLKKPLREANLAAIWHAKQNEYIDRIDPALRDAQPSLQRVLEGSETVGPNRKHGEIYKARVALKNVKNVDDFLKVMGQIKKVNNAMLQLARLDRNHLHVALKGRRGHESRELKGRQSKGLRMNLEADHRKLVREMNVFLKGNLAKIGVAGLPGITGASDEIRKFEIAQRNLNALPARFYNRKARRVAEMAFIDAAVKLVGALEQAVAVKAVAAPALAAVAPTPVAVAPKPAVAPTPTPAVAPAAPAASSTPASALPPASPVVVRTPLRRPVLPPASALPTPSRFATGPVLTAPVARPAAVFKRPAASGPAPAPLTLAEKTEIRKKLELLNGLLEQVEIFKQHRKEIGDSKIDPDFIMRAEGCEKSAIADIEGLTEVNARLFLEKLRRLKPEEALDFMKKGNQKLAAMSPPKKAIPASSAPAAATPAPISAVARPVTLSEAEKKQKAEQIRLIDEVLDQIKIFNKLKGQVKDESGTAEKLQAIRGELNGPDAKRALGNPSVAIANLQKIKGVWERANAAMQDPKKAELAELFKKRMEVLQSLNQLVIGNKDRKLGIPRELHLAMQAYVDSNTTKGKYAHEIAELRSALNLEVPSDRPMDGKTYADLKKRLDDWEIDENKILERYRAHRANVSAASSVASGPVVPVVPTAPAIGGDTEKLRSVTVEAELSTGSEPDELDAGMLASEDPAGKEWSDVSSDIRKAKTPGGKEETPPKNRESEDEPASSAPPPSPRH